MKTDDSIVVLNDVLDDFVALTPQQQSGIVVVSLVAVLR